MENYQKEPHGTGYIGNLEYTHVSLVAYPELSRGPVLYSEANISTCWA